MTLGFEERLDEGRGNDLVRCWEDMKERGRKGKSLSKWEEKRKGYFIEKGVDWERIKKKRINLEDLMKRDKELQRKERWERIRGVKV